MNRSPLVAILVPTYNRRESLLRCVKQLQRLQTDLASFVIVVVLDGCDDGSLEVLKSEAPEVQTVEGDGSLWWSGCVNRGAERARALGATHYLILNDDVLLDQGALHALMTAAMSRPDAVIGSRIVYQSNLDKTWCVGGRADWQGRGVFMLTSTPLGAKSIFAVDWLPGMGSLIPAPIFHQLGGIDEVAFPQYFGDTDFSLRVKKAGIPVLVCVESIVVNDVESTGLLLRPGAITMAQAKALLFSMRSHANIPTRMRFWLRHCPPLLIPWQAARFYGPVLGSILKKWLTFGFRLK